MDGQNSQTKLADEDCWDDKDTKCGLGKHRPKWLQKLASPICFLIVFCLLSLVQGAFWTFFIGVITTIEKRYSFKSKITGLILLADNLSPIITSFIIAYFGGRGNRPFWLSVGMLITGISSILTATPYWIYGATSAATGSEAYGTRNINSDQFCSLNSTSEDCSQGKGSITVPAVVLLFLGNFINGIGSTTFYILGSTYLDDSISKAKAPMYFGILSCTRLFGPTLGFLLSATVLKTFENPSVTPNFNEKDPRWVGAWWIGFVVIGALLILLSALLSLFPKDVPWITEGKKDENADKNVPFKKKLKQFPKDVVKVLKNKLLISTSLGNCFYFMGAIGFFQYMPKYVESQFGQTASNSNALSGITSTIVMAFCFLLSGAVISKIKPRPRFLTGWVVLVDVVNCLGMMLAMNFGCESKDVMADDPQSGCDCNLNQFQPICDRNSSTTYFSACYANCSAFNFAQNSTTFDGCSSYDGIEKSITKGFCPSHCGSALTYYLVVVTLTKAFGATSKVGTIIITMRSVDQKDKAMALSVVNIILNLLANIPSPLIFGALVDASCQIWKMTCGTVGNCWVYDDIKFRYYLHGITAFIYFMAMLFNMMMCYYSGKLENIYEDEKIEEKIEEKIDKTEKSGIESSKL